MRALRRIPTVLALAVVLLLAGTVAYAAIPDRSGAINGCVNSRTGVLRVVDPAKGQRCIERPQALRETPVSWNQRGSAAPSNPSAGSSVGIASTDQLDGVPCDTKSANPGITRVRYWGSSGIQLFCQRPGDPAIPLTPETVTTSVEATTSPETSTSTTSTQETVPQSTVTVTAPSSPTSPITTTNGVVAPGE